MVLPNGICAYSLRSDLCYLQTICNAWQKFWWGKIAGYDQDQWIVSFIFQRLQQAIKSEETSREHVHSPLNNDYWEILRLYYLLLWKYLQITCNKKNKERQFLNNIYFNYWFFFLFLYNQFKFSLFLINWIFRIACSLYCYKSFIYININKFIISHSCNKFCTIFSNTLYTVAGKILRTISITVIFFVVHRLKRFNQKTVRRI